MADLFVKDIDDELHAQLKSKAALERKTMKEMVEEILKTVIYPIKKK